MLPLPPHGHVTLPTPPHPPFARSYRVAYLPCRLYDGSSVTVATLTSSPASLLPYLTGAGGASTCVSRAVRPSRRYMNLIRTGAAHHGGWSTWPQTPRCTPTQMQTGMTSFAKANASTTDGGSNATWGVLQKCGTLARCLLII
eukprot:177557-Chlamydomonas_euryale.AAC.11